MFMKNRIIFYFSRNKEQGMMEMQRMIAIDRSCPSESIDTLSRLSIRFTCTSIDNVFAITHVIFSTNYYPNVIFLVIHKITREALISDSNIDRKKRAEYKNFRCYVFPA